MKNKLITLFLTFWAMAATAQTCQRQTLPHREQLSADRVLYVMQDSEGYLWYATDGGGVCRDDGRQVMVFRSDADHQDLLGSNTVLCLAESGCRIFIGTSHGAHLLDKRDYTISRLTEVDETRVDDMLVTADGHCWLTANRKVYEFDGEGKCLSVYPTGDKYIFRLCQDGQGRLCCQQWEGGRLLLVGGRFRQLSAEWPDSVDFRRVTKDRRGNLLVADGRGDCYALVAHEGERWFKGRVLTTRMADSLRTDWQLSARPYAVAVTADGTLWYSTGKDIRRKERRGEEVVVSPTKDVSAMSFTPDGTLWMATIFGELFRWREGRMESDAYGSNEWGDAVRAMTTDSCGRLLLLYDRYVRLYDTQRHTLQQQSRQEEGVYTIELAETQTMSRWSAPSAPASDRLPAWLNSCWMWVVYVLLAMSFVFLLVYNIFLLRQRRLFLEQLKSSVGVEGKDTVVPQPADEDTLPSADEEWLRRAMACVENHLSDEAYTVEQLSSELCMSRMTFYRKIQALTGQKPSEFIRTIRLRRAAEWLREGRLSVTEISYACGFSSVSYFSRCFSTLFGVSPSRFSKQDIQDS